MSGGLANRQQCRKAKVKISNRQGCRFGGARENPLRAHCSAFYGALSFFGGASYTKNGGRFGACPAGLSCVVVSIIRHDRERVPLYRVHIQECLRADTLGACKVLQ